MKRNKQVNKRNWKNIDNFIKDEKYMRNMKRNK